MENLIFTQLSVTEFRQIFRQELERHLSSQQEQDNREELDKLLTIKQASEFLSLSVPTIYGLVSRSEIPHSKLKKRLYFSKQELLEWVKSGRRKTLDEISAEAGKYVKKFK